MNKHFICGNLGADPDIREVGSGDKVANFSVATNEKWKDKNTGEQKSATEWHRCVCWRQGLVGVIEQYLKKGDKVLIVGKSKTRKWTDQSGIEKYTTEIHVEEMKMLGGGQQDTNQQQPQQQHEPAQVDLEDDIPF